MVSIRKKVLKITSKMPEDIQVRFGYLLEDLKIKGPIQPDWPNYSKIADDKYHCHLGYKWAACWTCTKNSIEI